MKYFWAITSVIILTCLGVAAEVDTSTGAEIREECSENEVAVISMPEPNASYSHPGPPDKFNYNLCVSGISESEITSDECTRNPGFYISSKDETAHFSFEEGYNKKVCTAEMTTELRPECGLDNETALFSVSNDHNAHVAEPGFYDQQVCGALEQPENVSVTMDVSLSESDEVYFDGSDMDESIEAPPAELPYMAVESDSFFSGIVSTRFLQAERVETSEGNRLSMVTETDSTSFKIPFASGSHLDIEDRRDKIVEGEFLNSLNPSFTHFIPEIPTVRVILQPEVNTSSDLDLGTGNHIIESEHVQDGEAELNLE